MCPGVITYHVSSFVDLLDYMTIYCNSVPKTEKSCLYSILLEDIEYLRCRGRIRTIIKGQRDFWQMDITTVEKPILGLKTCYLFLESNPLDIPLAFPLAFPNEM